MRRTDVQRFAVVVLVLVLEACRSAPKLAPERALEASTAARQAILQEATLDPSTLPMQSVGVTPMHVSAVDTLIAPLSYGLADLLITDLARSGQLRVVDRIRMDAFLRELNLVESGRVDTGTAPKLGKLVGARRLVVGSLLQAPGGQLSIDARIADAATSEVRQAVSARAPLADILDAEKALVFRLFDELGVTLTPAERVAVEQRPTRNIAALLAYSRGVRHEVHGRYEEARAEYASAVQIDPSFELARSRLEDAGGGASTTGGRASTTSIRRAASAAVDGVNPALFSHVGGAADPAFAGAQSVTLIITITSPP
jgi:TolB-like protein